jgi:hypothetical protein
VNARPDVRAHHPITTAESVVGTARRTPLPTLRTVWFRKIFSRLARSHRNLAEPAKPIGVIRARYSCSLKSKEEDMGFGRGALLWLLGIPLPIILLLALFMHH